MVPFVVIPVVLVLLLLVGTLHVTAPLRALAREAAETVFPPLERRRELAPARRFAELESQHAAECLAALTTADVEWLKWWGWTPDEATEDRLREQRYQELRRKQYRREAERAQEKALAEVKAKALAEEEAKAEMARRQRVADGLEKPTQVDLRLLADARVQGGQVLSSAVVQRRELEAQIKLAQGGFLAPDAVRSQRPRVTPLDWSRGATRFGTTVIDGVRHQLWKQDGRVYALPIREAVSTLPPPRSLW